MRVRILIHSNFWKLQGAVVIHARLVFLRGSITNTTIKTRIMMLMMRMIIDSQCYREIETNICRKVLGTKFLWVSRQWTGYISPLGKRILYLVFFFVSFHSFSLRSFFFLSFYLFSKIIL